MYTYSCRHTDRIRRSNYSANKSVNVFWVFLFFYLLTFLIKSGISFLSESWFKEAQLSTSKTYPSLWISPFGDLKRQMGGKKKKNQFLFLNTVYPNIFFTNISHGELTFRQNLGSSTFTPLSSTLFWQAAATASHLLAMEANRINDCRWWNASGTSKFIYLSKKHIVSLASMANTKEIHRWCNSEYAESRFQCNGLWAPQGSLM